MNENPFQAPQTMSPAVGVLGGTHEDLRAVAGAQRGILMCILIYLVAVIAQFAFPPDLRPLIGLCILPVGVVGAFFVFKLAMKVYGTGPGIFLGILSLVPLLGLIVLLGVNGKATGVLNQNGIKVGLLGADVSSI